MKEELEEEDDEEEEEFLASMLNVSCCPDLVMEKNILITTNDEIKVGMWTFIVEFSDIEILKYKSVFQKVNNKECASFQRLMPSAIISSILMLLLEFCLALFNRVGDASEG